MAEKYIKLQDAKDVFYYSLADGDCAIADYHEAYELLDSLEEFEFERGVQSATGQRSALSAEQKPEEDAT